VQQVTSVTVADLPPAALAALVGTSVILGFVYCYVGYRVFRFLLALTGFLLAGAMAAALAGWATHGQVVVMAVALVLGGMAGAMAMHMLYRGGVCLLGGLGAAAVAYNVLSAHAESWAPWAVLGAAVAGGLLALWFEAPIMMLATAAIGASMVVHGAILLASLTALRGTLENPNHETVLVWGVLAGWLVLTFSGVLVQFHASRKKRPH